MQSLKDIEIILINDGSSDNSFFICKNLAKNDTRISLVNKKNEGLCAARNLGIKMAKGEYIAFLDHDDEYMTELLYDNYHLAKKYDADIVKFGFECVDYKHDKTIKRYALNLIKGKEMLIKKENKKTGYCLLSDNVILTYIWDGLYKREFILQNNIKFDTQYSVGREDIAFNFETYSYLGNMVYNSKVYYKHYIYPSSTYHGMKKEKHLSYINGIVVNFGIEKRLLNKLGIRENYDGYYEYRLMKQIMDVAGFIIERPEKLDEYEMKKYFVYFRKLFRLSGMQLRRGFNKLNWRQRIIIVLFYLKWDRILVKLIYIYSRIRNCLMKYNL